MRVLTFGMRAYRCTECLHRFFRFPSQKRTTRAFASVHDTGSFPQSSPSSAELSLSPPKA